VLAAALVYLFVSHYKKNAPAAAAAAPLTTVWVATHPILQGTPESEVAALGYFTPQQVAVTKVMPGAITDPALIAGEVANATVAAHQQITAADFVKAPVLASALKGSQRAVAFTFDSEHGITSWLAVGDTVDVMLLKKNASELVAQNVTVLENLGGLVALKLTDKQALLLTGFTNKGSLWLSLRPAINAKDSIRIYSQGA
jgi:Flp pilus assembly protein CpaB